MSGGITERLAAATARRAKRTIAVWVAVVVVACVLVATLLHGLTSKHRLTVGRHRRLPLSSTRKGSRASAPRQRPT